MHVYQQSSFYVYLFNYITHRKNKKKRRNILKKLEIRLKKSQILWKGQISSKNVQTPLEKHTRIN